MEIIEILKVIFLGIVQGITEWLPISSTGHMILVDELIHLNVTPAFMEMFLVIIQFGSILAVLFLYFHKLNPFSPKKTKAEKKDTVSLWIKVLVASIPAGVIGLLFDDMIHAKLYSYITVAITLIVYGIFFIVIENRNKKLTPKVQDIKGLTYKMAAFIGAFQMLALIPGTSRSGSTIIGAMLLGVSRTVSAEFSFFMAIPAMVGASLYKLLKFGFTFTGVEIITLITGMIVAFVVSVVVIKFLMKFIQKNDFKPFGYYRIVLGIIVLIYFFFVR